MIKQRVLSDRYRLLVKVGEGGMAEVYRAQDVLLGRAVAVKLLRPQYTTESSFLVRFLHEAQAAAGLSHPNIVAVYDVGQDGTQRYIVMEYVEGVNLKEVILESAPFSVERAVSIAVQICQAVGIAHRAGLVHRDIKPQNVLLTTGDRAKVTDFGIAIALRAPKGLTEEGTVWGTPHYISPEQAMGEDVGPASDVYSIGVVLFEMLTGRLPFDGENSVAIAMKHIREAPPPVSRWNPAVPPEMAAIVDKALSKSPEGRYRTAVEFAQVLRNYQKSAEQARAGSGGSPPIQPVAPVPRPVYVPEPVDSPEDLAEEPFEEELPPARSHVDWLTIMLLVAAAVGMIALIPIGYLIFRTYAAAPPPPLPSPTPTVFILKDDIRVPDLMGLSREEAQNRLNTAGLRLEIVAERFSDNIPQGRVMEQERPAGQTARRGESLRAVLSKGPEPKASSLPRFIGQDAAETKRQLKANGFAVETSQQWGGSIPAGTVMQQEPLEGATVMPGANVKLVVSSGPRFKVNTVFDNNISLATADLERDQYAKGETIPLSLNWTAQSPVRRDYNVFVHLSQGGRNLVEKDNPPVQGARPTSGWVVGEMIRDVYALPIPADAAPGEYWLEVGFYNPQNMQRLPVTNPGLTQVVNQAVLLRPIHIQDR